MRKLALALGFALLASTAAQAVNLTGNLEIGGGSNIVNFTSTTPPITGTIQFVAGSTVLPATNGTSGNFLPLVGDAVAFPAGTLNFNTLTADNPFLTIDGLTFNLMTENPATLTTIGNGQSIFSISGTGTFHEAGFTDTPGTFDLSTQSVNGVFQNVSFSASASAVPGPIVGAGLPGLLSAFGLGGLWWRRRRVAA